MKLSGGPLDGEEVAGPLGAEIHQPFVRPRDDGTDMILGHWVYDRDGHYLGEVIDTETMGADETQRTLEWLWPDEKES